LLKISRKVGLHLLFRDAHDAHRRSERRNQLRKRRADTSRRSSDGRCQFIQ
jgi:hypothetical protein